MSHKRPLDALVPEQEPAPSSPRKRLRRTVLVMMWLERRRRARAVTLEQMARQGQLDMEKLFFLLKEIFSRLRSLERLPEQFDTLERSVMGSIQVLRTEMQEGQAASLPNAVYDRSRPVMGSIQVLRTEMQQRQEALLPNVVYERSRQMLERLPETGISSGVVTLRFVDADRPKDPIYTGSPVQWRNGQKAKVAIFRDGKQIKGGDLSELQIEILPVHADFFTERGQEVFTEEEFNKQIHMCKGKESVLTTVNLRNGEAYLGSIIFTESSHSKMLRLTARVKRQDLAVRVQEAISHRFIVKDRRSESNEKSDLPSKGDVVHRLKRISQKGKHCSVLAAKNITTVKHLMRQYHKDESGLQKLTGMKKANWSTMIEHASTCDPGDEIYSYRVAEENCELLFNDLYDLVGIIINGLYVPVRNLDQFQQRKVINWKMSAYKKLEERENSGGLIPDYLMINGHPAPTVPLNNEAGPSVHARPTWQYPNDMAAHQEVGEQHPFWQQNGFSMDKVLSNNDAGPSMQETLLFSQHTYEHIAQQELCQHDPSMPQNGTPYYPPQGNILNGQQSSSRQPTIPSNNVLPVPGASLIDQPGETMTHLQADAPGTACPVTDGVTQGSSSFNYGDGAADFWNGLPTIIEELLLQGNLPDQGFVQDNEAELPNSNIQFDDYEHDGGNR